MRVWNYSASTRILVPHQCGTVNIYYTDACFVFFRCNYMFTCYICQLSKCGCLGADLGRPLRQIPTRSKGAPVEREVDGIQRWAAFGHVPSPGRPCI